MNNFNKKNNEKQQCNKRSIHISDDEFPKFNLLTPTPDSSLGDLNDAVVNEGT